MMTKGRELMAESPDPSCFNADLIGEFLLCYNQWKEMMIAIEDIVCILPDTVCRKDGYKLLFLQRKSEHANTEDCAYLGSIQLMPLLPSKVLSQYLCTELPCHLQAHESEVANIHIVVSTASGTGTAKTVHKNILQPFLWHLGLFDCKVHETRSCHTITELCQSLFIPCAEADISQTIILLSGDGGIVDIIDAFYSADRSVTTQPIIALIPTGTGNAMASSLGLMSHPAAGLKELLRGRPRPLPIFVAEFSPGAQYVTNEGQARALIGGLTSNSKFPKTHGAVVASWGIHAALVADSDTDEYRRFGVDRFKMAAQELLFPPSGAESHKYTGTITLTRWNSQTNSEYVETMGYKEHMYVLATLVPRLEKEFVISPESVPLDGRLRIIHFGPVPAETAMQLMASAYQAGKHVSEGSVFYSEIEGLRIEFQEADERWRRVCIDGKVIAVERDGWMEVHKEPERLLSILTSAGF